MHQRTLSICDAETFAQRSFAALEIVATEFISDNVVICARGITAQVAVFTRHCVL
jgi:hypothetical protein